MSRFCIPLLALAVCMLAPQAHSDNARRGTDGPIYTICNVGDTYYCGGDFSTAGKMPNCGSFACWNRTTNKWSCCNAGGGVKKGSKRGKVRVIVRRGDDLLVGGDFNKAGAVQANNIAIYNTKTRKWRAIDGGCNGQVWSIASCNGTTYYVGGSFNQCGMNRIGVAGLARLDYSKGKFSVCPGWNAEAGAEVRTVACCDANLYCGGTFRCSSPTRENFAKCKVSTMKWDAELCRCDARVTSISCTATTVCCVGEFRDCNGTACNGVAVHNGQEWVKVDPPTGQEGTKYRVSCVAPDGSYVVGGEPAPRCTSVPCMRVTPQGRECRVSTFSYTDGCNECSCTAVFEDAHVSVVGIDREATVGGKTASHIVRRNGNKLEAVGDGR